ncbi:hypothetical protein N7474_004870 [Penicillium riverlandense]|uniref:uncharacterized protein n=1 Tax=Penicillium riverlandense TaxID=1903569 RepID=UPI0025471DE8|nr:uncharacterized protein N7474_004870 [Penicillium riverlandense]KAJ5819279.1 hypothetical protein N7474_004870 [Penicillium riverlandense]
MPSVSVLSEYTFANWGPLTTTWTPPASCQSFHTDYLGIAHTSAPELNLGQVSCGVPTNPWGCLPTGTITDLPTATSWFKDIRKYALYENYYSPGLDCPSGWGPVATASRNGTKTVEWNGAIGATTTSDRASDVFLFPNVPNNVFLQVLAPSETAVLCCPTSMTPGFNGDDCYSIVPDYTPSTMCQTQLPQVDVGTVESKSIWWYGTTVEANIMSITGDATASRVMTTTLESSDLSSLVAVTVVAPLTLVHQPTDLSAAATSNPAARLKPSPSNWNGIGAVLGITAAGMMMGAAIVFPW